MTAIERIFREDYTRSVFNEVVADDSFDFVDELSDCDDDYSDESEDL